MGEITIRLRIEEWMPYVGLGLLLIYTCAALASAVIKYKLLKLNKE